MNPLSALLDFLYPPRCLGCGARVDVRDVLCPACMLGLVPWPMTPDASVSHLAALSLVTDARIMLIGYEYEDGSALAECIHAMKYRSLTRIGVWLGRLLGERIAGTAIVACDPVLLPVPLHPMKQRERGYNQAVHLCAGIAAETGLTVRSDALLRRRDTRSQALCRLDRQARQANVRDAFSFRPEAQPDMAGRPVILVDDLITTGATIAECAATCVDAGITDVRLLAVARPPVR